MMKVNWVTDVDTLPENKQHTVRKGMYVDILNNLMASDKPAMIINCDTVAEAIKRNSGLYNASVSNNIPVKVWRRGADVYVKKEDTNGRESM